MKFRKLGRCFVTDNQEEWIKTHVYIPVPLLLDDRIRVFCSFWDTNQIMRIGFVDLKRSSPLEVIGYSKKPVLDVGNPGCFDEHGVIPTCVFKEKGITLLYFIGWQKIVGIPRLLFSSIARLDNTFDRAYRYKDTPFLDRCNIDKYMRSALIRIKGEEVEFSYDHFYYVGANDLLNINGNLIPKYHLKYFPNSSQNKNARNATIVLEAKEDEIGIGKSAIYVEDNIFKCFYSKRVINKGYSIGYAEKLSGHSLFERKDEEFTFYSRKEVDNKWDSEMQCFPSLLEVDGKRYMFYNGNDYGKTGFGVAVME